MFLKLNKKIRIIDSMQHLPSSLEKLVQSLKTGGYAEFKITRQVFGSFRIPLDMLLRKQVMCYDYITQTFFLKVE